jgi:hypothetical protein
MRNQGRNTGDDQDRFGGGRFGRDYDDDDNHRNSYRNQRRDNEGRFMSAQRAGWRERDEEGRFTSDRWGNGNRYREGAGYGRESENYRYQGRDETGRFTGYERGAGQSYNERTGNEGWAGQMQKENAQFDDDYNHWRQEQISKLDEDYATWLSERRQKFADEFDKWRSERRKGATHSGTEKKQ